MTHPCDTPLRSRHDALGASFTDFGGRMMPVRYTSDLAEHHAVRNAAGLFDVSHMAQFWVQGGRAADFLDYALSGRISSLAIGKAKYSLVLAADGGILDDVIVYRTDAEQFLIVANAGNRAVVAAALADAQTGWTHSHAVSEGEARAADEMPRVEDASDRSALVAVQGPRALEVLLATAGIEVTGTPLDDLGYYAWTAGTFSGASFLIARTGYTGENGYEIVVPSENVGELWDALLAAGAPCGLVPAGLAARDTLRLEAGMPLYGHELDRTLRPGQVGLGRVVANEKGEFVGARAAPPDAHAPVLVGVVSDGKRAGRAGYAVFDGDQQVGEITSGALSPTLGHPIAMALVQPHVSAVGTALSIDVRGTRIAATVTALPFYQRAARGASND